MPNRNWKGVHRFVSERFGLSPSRSSCLNYLHRLGFVLKRPKKRLVKADEAKREALNSGVRRPDAGGATDRRQDILRRRGPLQGRC